MEKTDYIKSIDGAERRVATAGATMEVRAAEGDKPESAVIVGYAAKFNQETEIGGWYRFREVIADGAFDDVLADDVRALFNHDPNFVLARTTAGTLKLSVDEIGLKYEYETPDVSYARDLAENIRLGNVSQSSFAFSIGEESWSWAENKDQLDLRTIKKFSRLYDVSPVTYPAYQDTEVAARSAEQKRPKLGDAIGQRDQRKRYLDLMSINSNKL